MGFAREVNAALDMVRRFFARIELFVAGPSHAATVDLLEAAGPCLRI
jgi:hypothetical protein